MAPHLSRSTLPARHFLFERQSRFNFFLDAFQCRPPSAISAVPSGILISGGRGLSVPIEARTREVRYSDRAYAFGSIRKYQTTCPNCKLENPTSASACDCGHLFSAAPSSASEPAIVYQLRSISDTVRSIRNMLLLRIIGSIAGGLIGGVYFGVTYVKAAEDAQRVQRQLEQQSEKLKR